jgi:hypothetical protein
MYNTLTDARVDISGYANTKVGNKDLETIAEALADFKANGRKAKPLSIVIVKILKETLK